MNRTHDRRFRIDVSSLALVVALLLSSAFAAHAAEVDFVDRVGTGEIVLPSATLGIGVIDFDNDGWFDLLLGNPQGQSNLLLRNIEDPARPGMRTFSDVTAGSGLDDQEGIDRSAFGFTVADFDNDGDSDVYILGLLGTRASSGLLYENNGDGTFTNVTESAGLRESGYSPESSAACDYDNDGDIDLLVANTFGSLRSILLYRNQGDGTFADASDLTPDLDDFTAVYTTMWSDYDQDGWMDCFVVVWGDPATLLHNVDDGSGGRTFVNAAEEVGFTGLGFAPMGITSGDIDGDGDFDYAVSNGNTGRYFENQGNGTLSQIQPFASVFGWGNALFDAENDRDLDYYMAGSWSAPALDKLFRNLGDGQWEDVSPSLNGIQAASRFSVQVDFNNDGLVDIITMNPGTASQLMSVYENVSDAGDHWIKLALHGDRVRVSHDAAGAIVRLTAGGISQVAEVNRIGSSTASTEDPRLHFGLGADTVVDRIEVLWPREGTLGSRLDIFEGPIPADQILTLEPRYSAIELCGSGAVGGDTPEDVLTVNGTPGNENREVMVAEGDAIVASINLPIGGGNGTFVMHANLGPLSNATRSVLPAKIGVACYPFLLDEGATPDAGWNNIGRKARVGGSFYFDGTPLPDPPAAPVDFLDLPGGDPTHLPLGTCVTLQGIIRDPGSNSPKNASLTNAVLLVIL